DGDRGGRGHRRYLLRRAARTRAAVRDGRGDGGGIRRRCRAALSPDPVREPGHALGRQGSPAPPGLPWPATGRRGGSRRHTGPRLVAGRAPHRPSSGTGHQPADGPARGARGEGRRCPRGAHASLTPTYFSTCVVVLPFAVKAMWENAESRVAPCQCFSSEGICTTSP